MTPILTELPPEDFRSVLPLYRAADNRFPLISAVIQNRQRGQVFVDDLSGPHSAAVVSDFGFAMLLGDPHNDAFRTLLLKLMRESSALKPKHVRWYNPPPRLQKDLLSLHGAGVRPRTRVRLEHRSDARLAGQPDLELDGFELRDLTSDLIPAVDSLGLNIGSRFWSSAADFLETGTGVCLVRNGQVASLCYSAALVDSLAEVDVATDPAFRRRGFAAAVTHGFTQRCAASRIVPMWDCFDYNTGSLQLARSSGFVEIDRYSFLSFDVPLPSPN